MTIRIIAHICCDVEMEIPDDYWEDTEHGNGMRAYVNNHIDEYKDLIDKSWKYCDSVPFHQEGEE